MSKVITPEFRVAFPQVFQPKENALSGKMEYGVVALFPKGADISVLKKAAQDAIAEKLGPDKKKWPKTLRSPFRNQGDREKVDEETGKNTLPQGYEKDAIYLSLKSQQRPGVVDTEVQPIIDTSEFYGGCWAIASVNAYYYDKAGNKGVSFGLMNLQKVKDGDAFGNRTKPEDDFTPVQNPDATSQDDSSAASLFS